MYERTESKYTLVCHSGTAAFKTSGHWVPVPCDVTVIKSVYPAHSLFLNFFVTLRKMAIIFLNIFSQETHCVRKENISLGAFAKRDY
jgi:hypothetical protein